MAKIVGGVPPFIGTRDNLTIYLMKGEYFIRTKSSLTGKRVKRDPAFAKTMKYAGWLRQGARIASGVYRQLPDDNRVYKRYRELTGKAMLLLKEGFSVEDVITMLEAIYLPQPMKSTADMRTKYKCENAKSANANISERADIGMSQSIDTIVDPGLYTSICVSVSEDIVISENIAIGEAIGETIGKDIGDGLNENINMKMRIKNKRPYYCWGDRPQRAVLVGITGLSYLKYADAPYQGFNGFPKAHPPSKAKY